MNIEDFVAYYSKLKELTELHRKLKFGDNPQIAEVFSEQLTRSLFGYSKWGNKKFDAKTVDGFAVEIKATGTDKGKTTINIKSFKKHAEEFSHLIWLYIDFDENQLSFKKISLEALIEWASTKKETDNGRVSIALHQLTAFEKTCFQINEKSKTIVKI
ncbi:hypothetical protein ACUSRQ_005100 [Vibrio harveyi]|uniref:Protein NO VEIN C-terminal domain-containing protein n=1 Tax=Vibrio alfacsensis TaxID=1074311 RepID=A0ABM6YUF3_9VIBR|nr:hypothetical protein [Vibrio alfacsensis]AXY01307.1 hypothetical protein D1115_09120 [Vibrio alfacsensis]